LIFGIKIGNIVLLLMNVSHSFEMVCHIMSTTTFYSMCLNVIESGGRFPRPELQDPQSRDIRFNVLLFRVELPLKLTTVPTNDTRTEENRTNV
jgi:hypothetical protein